MNGQDAVYQRIGDEIKQEIIKKGFANGYKLPSENDLVKKYQVSRTTIQRALRYLENQGLIRREKGKGSFVNLGKTKIDIFNFSGFSDYVKQMDKQIANQIIKQNKYEENGREYFKLERLRGMVDERGISWLTLDNSVLSLELFPELDRFDFEKESLYDVIRQQYGVYPQYSHLKSKAIIATKEQKKYFNLTKETALVQVVGTVFDGKENVVEHVSIIYSPIIDFNFLVSI